jgi:P4 family phage/plasmid primase-like protien
MAQRRPKGTGSASGDGGNVVELDDYREERKVPPLQNKLDVMTQGLLNYLDRNGLDLRFSDGTWYIYELGVWAALGPRGRQQADYRLKERAEEVGLVFAKEKKTIWAHLEATEYFDFDPSVLDKDPWVVVRNGTVNVETGELYPHDKKHYTTRLVDIDYDPDAKCPGWIKSLERAFEDRSPEDREKVIGLLQEFFGVALAGGARSRTPRALRKALFLYGPPRSGKSTIIDVLEALIGASKIVRSNARAVADKHELENFIGASAWITNEQSGLDRPIDAARIKCLITGEPLSVPRKYMSNAYLVFNGPVVWAGNTQPNFPESSRAVYDRTMVVSMERMFTEADAKRDFGNLKPLEWFQVHGELPGIFVWALEGYRRAVTRGHYEEPPELEQGGDSWRAANDPYYAFTTACCEEADGVFNDVDVVTWAAVEFIAHNEGNQPSVRKTQQRLSSTIPETYRSVKKRRDPSSASPRGTYWEGLRLNKLGLSYLQQAERNHETVAKMELRPNQGFVGGGK